MLPRRATALPTAKARLLSSSRRVEKADVAKPSDDQLFFNGATAAERETGVCTGESAVMNEKLLPPPKKKSLKGGSFLRSLPRGDDD